MAYSFNDSGLAIVLNHCMVEMFESDAVLTLVSNADGVGYTARVLTRDGQAEFSRAGSHDPIEAISLACARANEVLTSEDETEDETIGTDDD